MSNGYDATNKIGMGLYHLDPRWCSFEDFKYMADLGIFNSYKLQCGYGTSVGAIQIAKEHGSQVWLGMESFQANENLSGYVQRADRFIQKLKEQNLWDTIVGFHWDEPISASRWTNEAFRDMTKAFSEEYGKRIFPVFASFQVAGTKGNFSDPDDARLLTREATKYITDFGYDAYGFDFRRPYSESMTKKINEISQKFPEVTSVDDYYRFYLKTLEERMENKNAKVWVFPAAYTTNTWAGYKTDEDYCIAHLEGLKKILFEFKNPGGIFNYTYKTWNIAEPGMDLHLSRNNPERWNKYEEACRKVLNEIKDIEVK